MDYFAEKARQVDPPTVRAFGIPLTSRYGKAEELAEMLRFAEALAEADVHTYVTQVHYDSKGGGCTFEFVPSVVEGSQLADTINRCAEKTLTHFVLFDVNGVGEFV